MTSPQAWAVALAMVLIGSGTASAQGQEPTALGESGDWAAYFYKSDDGKVCYVVAQPKSSEPKAVKRDPIFFLVTHRPGQAIRNEVSTIIGYAFKKDANVEIKVDDQSFELFTNGDGAWAETKDKDKVIVQAMRKGRSMEVKGTSVRGTSTVDNYSLAGLKVALEKIDGACK